MSVVIAVQPAHNCQRFLGECLEALSGQTFPHDRMEAVLVGDGCKIASGLCPAGLRTRVLDLAERPGPVECRTRGLGASDAELVAFTDADCVPDRAWLEKLVAGLSSAEIAGCSGRITDYHSGRTYENRLEARDYILPCTGFGNVVYRRSVIDELHFLDQDLCLHAEEPDFCWRLYLKGYRIAYVPEALVAHKTHRSARKFFLYGMATRYLTRKFGALFAMSPITEYRQVLAFNRTAMADTGTASIAGRLKPLAAVAGYSYALAKEMLGLPPRIRTLTLAAAAARPAQPLRPLAVRIDSRWPVKPDHVIWWRSGAGCTVQNLLTRERFSLSGTSGEIWTSLLEGRGSEEILATLRDEYDSDEGTIREDLEDFVRTLLASGLLSLAGSPACRDREGEEP